MVYEGSKPVRKAKINILERKLIRFVMLDEVGQHGKGFGIQKMDQPHVDGVHDESLQTNKYNVIALIRQDSTYKRISFDDVLGRITKHDMYIEEANHVKNLFKGITTTRKQEIAFKTNKKSKNKQEVVESSNKEEEDSSECDDEDMTLFMKKFTKGDKKPKTTTKRTCYNDDKHDHFIANCPFEHRDDGDDKKKYKPYKKDKCYKRSGKPYKKKSYGEAHIGQE
jgi:hypothetical protein